MVVIVVVDPITTAALCLSALLWHPERGGEKRKSYRPQKGWDLVKFNGFLHAGAHVGDSYGLPGLKTVALERLKPREKQELKQSDRRGIYFCVYF